MKLLILACMVLFILGCKVDLERRPVVQHTCVDGYEYLIFYDSFPLMAVVQPFTENGPKRCNQ